MKKSLTVLFMLHMYKKALKLRIHLYRHCVSCVCFPSTVNVHKFPCAPINSQRQSPSPIFLVESCWSTSSLKKTQTITNKVLKSNFVARVLFGRDDLSNGRSHWAELFTDVTWSSRASLVQLEEKMK